MDVRSMVVDHNSEDNFQESLLNVLAAGSGLIHVRSPEVMRTLYCIRQVVILESNEYAEWDVRNGTRRFTHENMYELQVESDKNPQMQAAMQAVWDKFVWWINEATEDEKRPDYIFCFVNPQYQLERNPACFQHFLEMNHHLPESTVKVIFLTDDIILPIAYSDKFVSIDFARPGHGELKKRLEQNLADYGNENHLAVTEDDYDRIAIEAAGMTFPEFDATVSRTIVDTINKVDSQGTIDPDAVVDLDQIIVGVHKGKTEAIKKNEILDLLDSGDMEDVGGMDIAKEWVQQRSNCYSDEAIAFGVEPPKGMVSVGVPGSGKSLLAKAVGGVLGIPVVRLDFGRVFNSLVGSSEERIRKSLSLVESMSPCVLLVDEIDKGLGGLGGSGDSGTSMRVFGTFLTWLNDHTKPVFTMVTANNVTGLPPELLRRGRFDAIFATTMPNEFEREDVLAIHLRLRGHSIDDFEEVEVAEFLSKTDACVPAEIESIVKDGLVLAFNENMKDPELTMGHLLEARESMVPLSISHKEAIDRMVDWAKANATPASYTAKQLEGKRKKRKPKQRAQRSRRVRSDAKVTNISRRRRGKKDDTDGDKK